MLLENEELDGYLNENTLYASYTSNLLDLSDDEKLSGKVSCDLYFCTDGISDNYLFCKLRKDPQLISKVFDCFDLGYVKLNTENSRKYYFDLPFVLDKCTSWNLKYVFANEIKKIDSKKSASELIEYINSKEILLNYILCSSIKNQSTIDIQEVKCIGAQKDTEDEVVVYVNEGCEYITRPKGKSIFKVSVTVSSSVLLDNEELDSYLSDNSLYASYASKYASNLLDLSDDEKSSGKVNCDLYFCTDGISHNDLFYKLREDPQAIRRIFNRFELGYVRLNTESNKKYCFNLPFTLNKYTYWDLKYVFANEIKKINRNEVIKIVRYMWKTCTLNIKKMRCIGNTCESNENIVIRVNLSSGKIYKVTPCGHSMFEITIALENSTLSKIAELKYFCELNASNKVKKNSTIYFDVYAYVNGDNIDQFIENAKNPKKSSNIFCSIKHIMLHGEGKVIDLREELLENEGLKVDYLYIAKTQRGRRKAKSTELLKGKSDVLLSQDSGSCESPSQGSGSYESSSCDDLLCSKEDKVECEVEKFSLGLKKYVLYPSSDSLSSKDIEDNESNISSGDSSSAGKDCENVEVENVESSYKRNNFTSVL